VDNAEIARTLDAYAALLDLADAPRWGIRAYRRAAEQIRATPAPVDELVRSGRARELQGIGPGIERRLNELVETGRIMELEELEREVDPELVALGRYLGIGPQRLVALGKALGIRSADELRAAAETGRLREAPGVGRVTEAKVLAALSREPRRHGGASPAIAHSRWPPHSRSRCERHLRASCGAAVSSFTAFSSSRLHPMRSSDSRPSRKWSPFWNATSAAPSASRWKGSRSSSSPPSRH